RLPTALAVHGLPHDVTFQVGREHQEVFAHRCILACRCQAFHAMLSQPQEPQAPLVLSHVQPEVFLAVIEFLYTNRVTLNSLIVSMARAAGSCLEMGEGGTERGLHFIKDTLSAELACEALQVSGRPQAPWRIAGAIHPHLPQEAVQTQSFLELSPSALLPVLRSDRLGIDEAELIQAVRKWAHVGSAVLECPVPEVARAVVRELRLALLSPSDLGALEEENKKDQLIPVEHIAEAWKMHALRKGRGARGHLCRRRRGTLPREHHRYLEPPHKGHSAPQGQEGNRL
uniref:BTB domain containing 19 n=1 Tax=Sphenodon punctatus TaxID=8508 RepID=A0A8D0GBY3_SPHPU